MSVTQVILLGLVLAAFVMGWVARGRREVADSEQTPSAERVAEIDAALGAALTSFQAALAVWQREDGVPTPLAARTLATFEQHRIAIARLLPDAPATTQGRAALHRAQTAIGQLSEGLAARSGGAALDAERERGLLRAERMLTTARSAYLLACLAQAPAELIAATPG